MSPDVKDVDEAPIDGTDEARARAAAAREAAKRKHDELEKPEEPKPASKKPKKATPRIKTSTHTVAVPEGYEPDTQRDAAVFGTLQEPNFTGTPAKQYPFELDPFQKTSVACLERRESVLVAAHTSAGKTVVAEYAIAMAFRDKQRVIYTSPLKALSNQKFRELTEEFGDVGLMTGDVTINPNANCIVMTTEILRSMIYRGSELLREVAWVIFDEVHYMQDRERGVVWEETIIFLQDDAKMVFLSATLSNANEFSQWVAYLHKQPCHVVYTDYRPTPLEHYVCPIGGQGLYKVMGDKGFNEKNFKQMKDNMEEEKARRDAEEQEAAAADGGEEPLGGRKDRQKGGGRGGGRGSGRGRGRGKGGKGGKQKYQEKISDMQEHLTKLLRTLQTRHQEPLLVFSFSKRECEKYALACANPDYGNLCFASAEEADAIETVYNNMLQVLSPADRQLPALCHMLRILKRGIGVHHGGLLPILKEIIEILFQEGLIKVLFTTETFAMGLNMPARTVVFTNLKKFDGQEERYISSGEYIQMSGRAGRRGKDDRGTVIVCADDDLDMDTCKGLMAGTPNPLLSSFRLSYYTLLNLLKRVEGGTDSLEYVIAHSFQQFQQEAARPRLEAELRDLEQQSGDLQVEGQHAISEYKELRERLSNIQCEVQTAMQDPSVCLAFLRPGRLIRVKEGQDDWGWGVVVSVLKKPPRTNAAVNGGGAIANAAAAAAAGDGTDIPVDLKAVAANAASCYIVDTLLPCKAGSVAAGVTRPDPIGIGQVSGSAAAGDGKADGDAGAGAPAASSCAELTVVPVLLPLVTSLSSLRVTLPDDIRPLDVRQNLLLVLQDIAKKYPDGMPQLDPVNDMGIQDATVLSAIQQMDQLEQQLAKNPVFQAERDSERFALYARKAALDERAEEIRQQLKGTLLAQFKQEAKSRMLVLQKLNHINAEGTVLLKGRAACEIDTTDELLSTELMFNGCFHGMDKHQLLALVSCLVPCDNSTEEIVLARKLAEPLKQLQDTALSIAAMQRDANLECDDEVYLDSFKPTLMDVFYDWSLGKSFAEVAAKTDIFEGSIIRVARRLDELMQQLARAARVIGDEELAVQFEESNETLRRGIMFSASLYL